MATYLILNLTFLLLIVVLLRVRPRRPSRAWLVMFGCLMILTLIFDSLLVYLNIVGYDPHKILGIYLIHAPVEDFFYAILASIMIPTLWYKLEKK